MDTTTRLIDQLFDLHHEPDPDRRRKLAADLLADDIAFHGVSATARGIDGILEVFKSDGEKLVRTSGVDQHDQWARVAWEARDPSGQAITLDDGSPYGGPAVFELADDGRIRLIVPFLGDVPEAT